MSRIIRAAERLRGSRYDGLEGVDGKGVEELVGEYEWCF